MFKPQLKSFQWDPTMEKQKQPQSRSSRNFMKPIRQWKEKAIPASLAQFIENRQGWTIHCLTRKRCQQNGWLVWLVSTVCLPNVGPSPYGSSRATETWCSSGLTSALQRCAKALSTCAWLKDLAVNTEALAQRYRWLHRRAVLMNNWWVFSQIISLFKAYMVFWKREAYIPFWSFWNILPWALVTSRHLSPNTRTVLPEGLSKKGTFTDTTGAACVRQTWVEDIATSQPQMKGRLLWNFTRIWFGKSYQYLYDMIALLRNKVIEVTEVLAFLRGATPRHCRSLLRRAKPSETKEPELCFHQFPNFFSHTASCNMQSANECE